MSATTQPAAAGMAAGDNAFKRAGLAADGGCKGMMKSANLAAGSTCSSQQHGAIGVPDLAAIQLRCAGL